MIAVAGWLAWRAGGGAQTTLPWVIQLVLNLGWTVVFFGLQQPGWALVPRPLTFAVFRTAR